MHQENVQRSAAGWAGLSASEMIYTLAALDQEVERAHFYLDAAADTVSRDEAVDWQERSALPMGALAYRIHQALGGMALRDGRDRLGNWLIAEIHALRQSLVYLRLCLRELSDPESASRQSAAGEQEVLTAMRQAVEQALARAGIATLTESAAHTCEHFGKGTVRLKLFDEQRRVNGLLLFVKDDAAAAQTYAAALEEADERRRQAGEGGGHVGQ